MMVRRIGHRIRGFPIREYLRTGFSVDTRTLAVFRVFAGMLIIADVLLRSRNFHFFYTDEGVFPKELAQLWAGEHAFSVFFWTTDPTIIALLFVLHIVLAIQLIVGYKTRLATVLCFLFVISLDHRASIVISYADIIFRLLLFWAIFLPLGERWSIDALKRERKPRQMFFGLASILILGQMVKMYFINGFHKTQGDQWLEGEATPFILAREEITFLIGDYMYLMPYEILLAGGYFWFAILVASPLLFFLRGRWRTVFVFMFIFGHGSFMFTVRIGAFAYVGIIGVMLFLQGSFWDDLSRVTHYGRQKLHAPSDPFKTARSQLIRVGRAVPYYTIAPGIQKRVNRPIYDIVLIFFVLVTVVILATTGAWIAGYADEDSTFDEGPQELADALGINQPNWTIFAPNPGTRDNYYVFPAKTADGDIFDVYNDRGFRFDRPYQGHLQNQYHTYRERFYMNTIRRTSHDATRAALAEYHCNRWEEEHGTELTHLNMYHVRVDVTRDTFRAHEERPIRVNQIYRNNGASSPC